MNKFWSVGRGWRLSESVLTIIFFTLISQAVKSQDLKGVAFTGNAAYFSTPGLNSIMNSINEERIENIGFFMSGIDAYYRSSRAIVMISVYGGNAVQPTNSEIQSFAWMANSSFGWILFNAKATWIYPSLGLGANGLTLKRYAGAKVKESENLHGPAIDLSIHFDHLITDQGNNFNGILLGLRVGYAAVVWQKTWAIDLDDRPYEMNSTDFRGWYVTLSFGGLGYFKANSRSPRQE